MDIDPTFKVDLEEFTDRLLPNRNGEHNINKVFESIENLEDNIFKVQLKVSKESEQRIKAMMWFHQDYNPNHYSCTTISPKIKQDENGSRFEISRTIEYHPPKRNGHRRNHAPSELYREFAEQLAQEDFEKNSPVQTPFGEEYGLKKQLGLK